MEFIQAALTAVIEIIAIAGFGGCVVHALYSSHKRWMEIYCPPVKPFEPAEETMQKEIPVALTTEATEKPVIEESAEALQEPQGTDMQSAIAQAQEEANATIEKVELTEAEIDAAFKVPVLRTLCDQHGIVWKDLRGKGKHALKPAMIQALMSANAF
jgi:hypothetical protein